MPARGRDRSFELPPPPRTRVRGTSPVPLRGSPLRPFGPPPPQAGEDPMSELRADGGGVGGDGDDVLVGEVRHHALHQLDIRAGARAMFDVVELTGEIDRRASDDAGHIAEA